VPDWVKPSFVIIDMTSGPLPLKAEHRMATMDIKGLNAHVEVCLSGVPGVDLPLNPVDR